MEITFGNNTALAGSLVYPNLLDYSLAIGSIKVSINPAGLLVSRDGASPPGVLRSVLKRWNLTACPLVTEITSRFMCPTLHGQLPRHLGHVGRHP